MLKLTTSHGDLVKCAELLKNSEIAAIPTETVYGLAANALDPKAVEKIFKAKGRPADNPLIVHISGISELEKFCEPTKTAYTLAEKFWAGPLTVILPKKAVIPDIVTAGLPGVAIRMPRNETARKLISLCGFPLAAPSANISGKPSPTSAEHVLADFAENPHVAAVVDGGSCDGGLESTVVDLTATPPCLLRPGLITKEMLSEVIPDLKVAEAVLERLSDGESALSPGLKHKHYAPDAETFCLCGETRAAAEYLRKNAAKYTAVICFDGEEEVFSAQNVKTIKYGKSTRPEELAENLFSALRLADAQKPERIYIRAVSPEGVGLAVYNRILRASDFKIIGTEEK